MERVSTYEMPKKGKIASVDWIRLWKDKQDGMSYGEIARKYGISRGTVWLAIQVIGAIVPLLREYKKENAQLREEVERLRKRLRANEYDDRPY